MVYRVMLLRLMSAYFAIYIAKHSQVDGRRQSLVAYLFNESRYDKRVMPVAGLGKPLDITLRLRINKLEDLDEKKQQIITHGVLTQIWKDPHLVWNPSNFDGIECITVKPRRIWFPDIVLFNSAAAGIAEGLMRMKGLLYYNGTIKFKISGIFRTLCEINVDNYPIDQQECHLVFGSWGHHGGEITVKSIDNESFDLSGYSANGEWTLERTSMTQNLVHYGTGYPFYDVTFTVLIRREVLYYAIYLIIPGMLTALMASVIFVLPQDCSERVTLGMSVLVALSFFFLFVSEKMPASSKVTLIGGYYYITMIEMAVSFFLNVFILRFHHMTEDNVPPWVKKYLLHYGASFLRMRFQRKPKEFELKQINTQKLPTDKKDEDQVKKTQGDTQLDICAELFVADKVLITTVVQDRKIAEREIEWKKAAEVLNNFAMILHVLIVFVTFAVVFFKHLFR